MGRKLPQADAPLSAITSHPPPLSWQPYQKAGLSFSLLKSGCTRMRINDTYNVSMIRITSQRGGMKRCRIFMVGWREPAEVLIADDVASLTLHRPTGFLRAQLCSPGEPEAPALIPVNRIQLLVEAD